MKIVFTDTEFECTGLSGANLKGRECYKISFAIPYSDIAQYFINNASYYWENPHEVEGEPPYQEDLTDYCVFAGVFINPDNTCEVYMGKETTEEKLAETELALEQAILASVGGVV